MEDIVNFLFEAGMLRRVKRSGFWFHGIDNPESVAEHSHRSAIIGWILAKMENVDENKVMKMLILHDMPETRIGDTTKFPGKLYLETNKAEKGVISHQKNRLPEGASNEYESLLEEFNKGESKEAIVARDADTLELLITAKEKSESNDTDFNYWDKPKNSVKTESAKKILESIRNTSSRSWWNDVEDF